MDLKCNHNSILFLSMPAITVTAPTDSPYKTVMTMTRMLFVQTVTFGHVPETGD